MQNDLILFVISGFIIGLSLGLQAPGTILMKISYSFHNTEFHRTAYLQSKISSSGKVLYNKKDQMKPSDAYNDIVEVFISMDVTNIRAYMDFEGTLEIRNGYDIKTNKDYKFVKNKFQFNPNNLDGENTVPLSIYSSQLKRELEMVLSAKCERNYYPKNMCSVLCIKTKNAKYCDSKGNKVCEKGYYFNNKTRNCDNDWCFLVKEGCKNNGKCINGEKQFTCSCNIFYTGQYCDVRLDLCEKYVCPNETYCVISNEKIICKPISVETTQISSPSHSILKNISPHTLIMMMGFIILLVITIGVTVWACQNPKKKDFRSMETSINSGHSYYPSNSLSRYSNSCGHENLHYQRCLCMSKSFDRNKAYFSLKQPSRQLRPWNRAFSDMMIANTDPRSSLVSIPQIDETFPLPLPIDEENDTGYCVEL